jgi:hypothetical protein
MGSKRRASTPQLLAAGQHDVLVHRRHSPAVDADVGSVDVAGTRAYQECNRVSHVLRATDSAGRVGDNLLYSPLLNLGPVISPTHLLGDAEDHRLGSGRVNESGADRIHSDPSPSQFLGQAKLPVRFALAALVAA